jgi:hypothetical protein
VALEQSKMRLGAVAEKVQWITGDITQVHLPADRYMLWHDRAVFHFLTEQADREQYAAAATQSVKRGGFMIVATFAPDGPPKCSGLPVQRYDAAALAREFGFCRLKESRKELHITPRGATQAFTYVLLQRE